MGTSEVREEAFQVRAQCQCRCSRGGVCGLIQEVQLNTQNGAGAEGRGQRGHTVPWGPLAHQVFSSWFVLEPYAFVATLVLA